MKQSYMNGLDEVVQNLNKKVGQIEGVTLKGLIRASIPIRRTAQKLCPVVTGNLKASAYTVTSHGNVQAGKSPTFKGKDISKMSLHHSSVVGKRKHMIESDKNPTVEVGFTAEYAVKVHENPRAGKTGRPGASEVGQWKFLEEAVKQNENEVVRIIAQEVKKTL